MLSQSLVKLYRFRHPIRPIWWHCLSIWSGNISLTERVLHWDHHFRWKWQSKVNSLPAWQWMKKIFALCSLEAWIPCLFYHGELVDFEKIKSHHTLMLFMRLHLGKRSKSQALFLKKKFMGLVFGWNMEQWWLGWENPWGLDIESVWEYWNYSKTFNIIPPLSWFIREKKRKRKKKQKI